VLVPGSCRSFLQFVLVVDSRSWFLRLAFYHSFLPFTLAIRSCRLLLAVALAFFRPFVSPQMLMTVRLFM
ncbi:hypothetical protein, partial [Paenibacillus sp. UNC499MF]|uniref:hypothetical protein n=1 Tax=Paenibacillus sp. UNC499MF TaxID=1502751 RepID=UPI001CA50865